MEFLFFYGLFLAKFFTVIVAVVLVIGLVASLSMRRHSHHGAHLEITSLNDKYTDMSNALEAAILSKSELKHKLKADKKRDKAASKDKTEQPAKKKIFVLDFEGDISGSGVVSLKEEITATLTVATPHDEVVLRLESAGGMVHAYGLAASQLVRIKDKSIPLTVTVDKVAASGGYLMACVADRILAAPFAILGSIGVLTQIPNFHRLLKKHDIDFEQITSGEFKRTVTMFGKTTDKARDKLQAEVSDTHDVFKDFVKINRPSLNLSKVSTGEHWLGVRAKELDLVDEIRTSDDYLLAVSKDANIYEVRYKRPQTMAEKLRANLTKLAASYNLGKDNFASKLVL